MKIKVLVRYGKCVIMIRHLSGSCPVGSWVDVSIGTWKSLKFKIMRLDEVIYVLSFKRRQWKPRQSFLALQNFKVVREIYSKDYWAENPTTLCLQANKLVLF